MMCLLVRICWLLGFVTGLSLFAAGPGLADVYRYVDKNGIWHFTNVKTDSRYRIYLKSHKKDVRRFLDDYQGIIQQASVRFGIDPHLIRAVIEAESACDSRAVSSKGARGLMQLMPGTAREMGVEDSFDPAENIFGGVRYLSVLLKRFHNDKVLALAAYNAGPEAVETYKGVPPFTETREFVKRVMQHYQTHQTRTP